jgi:xeroderma pigmentosum group C-complementing protein
MKICKRLGIDYAEAVVGFEFGHRMAVPIISGVVVAEEHYDAVMEEWEKDEAERVRKEDEKRTRTAIGMWRKFLMGMRIIKRVREEYGDMIDQNPDALNPFTNHSKKAKKSDEDAEAQAKVMAERDEDMAGGFLQEGHDEEEAEPHNSSTFFPVTHGEEDDDDDHGGGFVIENHEEELAKSTMGQAYPTPRSLQSTKTRQVSEEDQEMKDAESEIEAPPPKKRGMPSGSTNKTPKTKVSVPVSKSKTPAKRAVQQKTPASRSTMKRKSQIADSEQDEDEDEISSLSELESGSEFDVEPVPKKVPKAAGRRATLPAQTASARNTPRRNTARKSEGAVRSRYFEHDDEEDDEE